MLIIGAGALLVGIIIYALIDCVRTESWQARALPKPVWLAVIVLFPLVGSLLWLFVGRPQDASLLNPLRNDRPSPPPQKAPDDDDEFLRFLDAKAKRERESREREQGKSSSDPDVTKDSFDGEDPSDEGQKPSR
ncbi:PLD nuclease N-terminal domain-containing protein [Rothia sp. ZJ1223]|uniref:PLD nuclease N-terminal domain-containing protein n=1 Tax=Rothia sp. ZJ1223 TaxID=2811098 RepID=UPI00195AF4B1|nr:PLD nuclease N-terminal domain-containing protein [Rothia sp. ZJ1223]MBM7051939.1 PLDc_N domain-containing protein [Rothia sp. ZJ1223]